MLEGKERMLKTDVEKQISTTIEACKTDMITPCKIDSLLTKRPPINTSLKGINIGQYLKLPKTGD